jgi:hypothetical protein
MPDPTSPPALEQINIVVGDMRKSLAFYRLLGLSIEQIPLAEWAPHHASGRTSKGVRVEFDSIAFAKQWNPGLDEAKLGSATIPFFHAFWLLYPASVTAACTRSTSSTRL